MTATDGGMAGEVAGSATIHIGPRRAGVDILYTPPKDTRDPRYAACVDHHVACDCREALWSENENEWRMERALMVKVFDRFIGDHSTDIMGAPNPHTGERDRACQCMGCQIYRAMHYYPGSGAL